MAKIENDKYYTSKDLAEYCFNKTLEIIGKENISEYIEPSAGGGVFIDLFDKDYLAFDIEPYDNRIAKEDYLNINIPYKIGRCAIGNPPFGKGNYTSVKFFKKLITECDYIAIIQPISQLNNNMYMYEFDLIHSENLGKKDYSGISLNCCFNIYVRPKNGLNSKPNFNLREVELKGVAKGASRNDKVPDDYSFSISAFGQSYGKICDKEYQYCQQIYFTIHNKKYEELIKSTISNARWDEMYDMISTPKIKHWMVLKYLKEQIPELN